VARHVITARKQTPLDGSNSQPSQSVTDGWYIDLDRSISCDLKPSPGSKPIGILSSGAPAGGKQMPIDRPEFVDIGARETGLPLKETRRVPTSTLFQMASAELMILSTHLFGPLLGIGQLLGLDLVQIVPHWAVQFDDLCVVFRVPGRLCLAAYNS
jgi:hypothetical protein